MYLAVLKLSFTMQNIFFNLAHNLLCRFFAIQMSDSLAPIISANTENTFIIIYPIRIYNLKLNFEIGLFVFNFIPILRFFPIYLHNCRKLVSTSFLSFLVISFKVTSLKNTFFSIFLRLKSIQNKL